jgi:FkbM family methyltransferase
MPLKSIVKRTLASQGWKLVKINFDVETRTGAFSDQARLFRETHPRMIFDIGANQGQTAAEYRRFFPQATIHSFEPFEDVFRDLEKSVAADPLTHAHRVAISDSIGTHVFHVNEEHCTNSLFPTAATADLHTGNTWTHTVRKNEVPTITLDEFCRRENIAAIDLLKMDVQGAEMLVLKGARALFDKRAISVIFAEVLFAKIYENQTDFCEMMTFLRERGYVLYGLYDLFYKGDLPLSWADAIFIAPEIAAKLEAAAAQTATPR